jgi:hypothetical protein
MRTIAKLYRQQWDLLQSCVTPKLDPASFPPELVAANDTSHTFSIGSAKAEIWFYAYIRWSRYGCAAEDYRVCKGIRFCF